MLELRIPVTVFLSSFFFLQSLFTQKLLSEQSLLAELSLPVISETSLIGIAQSSPLWLLEK